MRVEQKRIVKVDELAHLIPFKAGGTFSQLWQVFYYTRLFKYVHYRHYPQIKKSFNKVCSYKKLQELCRLGYLKTPRNEVYIATDKVLPVLKEAGYITAALPREPVGKGDINELNNTEAFINIIKQPYFYTLLYPQFGKPMPYLIPDALLVRKDETERRYKLTFLEIERKKPEWELWIEQKKQNYLRLSNDPEFYNVWRGYCRLLSFPEPDISKLKFDFKIIKDTEFTL